MGPHSAGRRTGETVGTTFRDVRAHHHAAGRHLRPPLGWLEKGVQKRPPGPPPDVCRDAQDGPTGTNEVSVCGNQEELWLPPLT